MQNGDEHGASRRTSLRPLRGNRPEPSGYAINDEYSALLELLAALRQKSGITQVELSLKLGQSQSFISKVEHGDQRLDVIQLRTICETLASTLPEFINTLEKRLRGQKKSQDWWNAQPVT